MWAHNSNYLVLAGRKARMNDLVDDFTQSCSGAVLSASIPLLSTAFTDWVYCGRLTRKMQRFYDDQQWILK